MLKKKNHNIIKEFQNTVHQYSGILFTICRRYAVDDAMAKDYLQDSWIQVYKNRNKYDQNLPLEPWLKRITINICLKNIRDNKTNYAPIDGIHIEIKEEAIDNLKNEELIQLVQSLPTVFKDVFNLYAIDGYSHKEIGTLLNISEGTSRSKYARGRKWLQEKILKSENQFI